MRHVHRVLGLGFALVVAGAGLGGCAHQPPDPIGQHRLLGAAAGAPLAIDGGRSAREFIRTRDRALDALNLRLVALDDDIDRLKREVALRTVDGRLMVATALVDATHRLDGQRAAAAHALQFARSAAASQWTAVLARVEGHLRNTQAQYDATAAQLLR